eukprot:gene4322-biopygen12531
MKSCHQEGVRDRNRADRNYRSCVWINSSDCSSIPVANVVRSSLSKNYPQKTRSKGLGRSAGPIAANLEGFF